MPAEKYKVKDHPEHLYVVFGKDSGHWWSWMLHPTIRHCYVMKADKGRWINYAKSVQTIDLFTIDQTEHKIGTNIIRKARRRYARQGLFMLNTCVGHAKQILGINKPFIWTPYQLLKYLEANP